MSSPLSKPPEGTHICDHIINLSKTHNLPAWSFSHLLPKLTPATLYRSPECIPLDHIPLFTEDLPAGEREVVNVILEKQPSLPPGEEEGEVGGEEEERIVLMRTELRRAREETVVKDRKKVLKARKKIEDASRAADDVSEGMGSEVPDKLPSLIKLSDPTSPDLIVPTLLPTPSKPNPVHKPSLPDFHPTASPSKSGDDPAPPTLPQSKDLKTTLSAKSFLLALPSSHSSVAPQQRTHKPLIPASHPTPYAYTPKRKTYTRPKDLPCLDGLGLSTWQRRKVITGESFSSRRGVLKQGPGELMVVVTEGVGRLKLEKALERVERRERGRREEEEEWEEEMGNEGGDLIFGKMGVAVGGVDSFVQSLSSNHNRTKSQPLPKVKPRKRSARQIRYAAQAKLRHLSARNSYLFAPILANRRARLEWKKKNPPIKKNKSHKLRRPLFPAEMAALGTKRAEVLDERECGMGEGPEGVVNEEDWMQPKGILVDRFYEKMENRKEEEYLGLVWGPLL